MTEPLSSDQYGDDDTDTAPLEESMKADRRPDGAPPREAERSTLRHLEVRLPPFTQALIIANVIGFLLHNTTEGLGIVTPLADQRPPHW